MEADAHVSDFQKKTSAKNRNVTNRMGSFKTCHLVQKKKKKSAYKWVAKNVGCKISSGTNAVYQCMKARC